MDGGAWWAAVHGVAKSRTRLSDFTFTFHFHALEKEMATHSSVLAWRIPGTGETGGLPSLGSHRVGHDWNWLSSSISWRWKMTQFSKDLLTSKKMVISGARLEPLSNNSTSVLFSLYHTASEIYCCFQQMCKSKCFTLVFLNIKKKRFLFWGQRHNGFSIYPPPPAKKEKKQNTERL